MKPFFSIMMPTYNQENYLRAAIDSVLAQTFSDFELLIVNDGSTDNTEGIMEEYAARDTRVKIFKKKNGGTASALNVAFANAAAGWLCWLSSDDLFLPNHLELRAAAIKQTPEMKFIYSASNWLVEEEKKIVSPNYKNLIPPPDIQTLRLMRINYVSGITITMRKEDASAGFDEKLYYAHDYEMWFGISLQHRFYYITEPTAITRIHKEQATAKAPVSGLLDGAIVGLAALNKSHFSALIPFADITKREILTQVVHETLVNLIDENSYCVIAGFQQALAARFAEWLREIAETERVYALKIIRDFIGQFGQQLGAENLGLLAGLEKNQVFAPYDGVKLLKARLEKYKLSGNERMVAGIEKYLSTL